MENNDFNWFSIFVSLVFVSGLEGERLYYICIQCQLMFFFQKVTINSTISSSDSDADSIFLLEVRIMVSSA